MVIGHDPSLQDLACGLDNGEGLPVGLFLVAWLPHFAAPFDSALRCTLVKQHMRGLDAVREPDAATTKRTRPPENR